MESGKEASVHMQLEGRPSLSEMVSLKYNDNFVAKFIQNLQIQASYLGRMVCEEALK